VSQPCKKVQIDTVPVAAWLERVKEGKQKHNGAIEKRKAKAKAKEKANATA
jgi:hypothetical protein